MTKAHRLHEEVLSALREKRFDRLVIRRFEATHYLVVVVNGVSHVFADPAGKKKEYRHAWQVRDWLKKVFGISTETIPVEKISR